jgi:hypothetical protein
MSEPRKFQIGDKVTFMRVTASGIRMSFSERKATITKIQENGIAIVKLANGHREVLEVESLRHARERNQVTEIFEAISGKRFSDPAPPPAQES